MELLEKIYHLPLPIGHLVAGLLLGILSIWLLQSAMRFLTRKYDSDAIYYFRTRCRSAFRFFIPVLYIFITLKFADQSEWEDALNVLFRILLILATGFLMIKGTFAFEDIILSRYDISKKEDNWKERKIITQLNFIRSVIILAIVFITLGFVLISFEGARKYGKGLLTSAGVVSIIIGFAAQKSIYNFLAGIQIAFTQPIRIDDAVVVEGEWGWIEEINLTYVVVRIWDWRRLILPITYFVDKPFQNWTRTKAEIIGMVILYLDYRAPVDKIRAKLTEILQTEPNWDGKVDNLVVSDTLESTIIVRALMSAKNSPMAWDLRCSVREKLIEFLQKEYPESLPVQRVEIGGYTPGPPT